MPRSRRRPVPRPVRRAAPAAAALRALPKIDDLLRQDDVARAIAAHGRPLVVALLRERLAGLRASLRGGAGTPGDPAAHDFGAWVGREAAARTASTLRPVINATGIVIHTNLGRAILSEAAAAAAAAAARGYTTLEYDLGRGARGSRGAHLERLAALLFPGAACHVVNNNAAALLLALNTLAEGKEVVVSRGELVEIGGSFRVPEIMKKSGALLKEVGSTNRTRRRDYERALGPSTGLLLKVHPSNFRIVGFTSEVPLRDLAALGRAKRIPVLMDQGSGNLIDLRPHGIQGEPTVMASLRDGADLVCCSGDKLLGGPQAGLLVGRPALVARARDNPLSRALRADKMTYAALEATLLAYVRGTAEQDLPVARMIALDRAALDRRARALAASVAPGAAALAVAVEEGASMTGGGSAPGEGLPTALLAVTSPRLSARLIEERLRVFTTPIIARIEAGRVLIDLRTVPQAQDAVVAEALASVAAFRR